MTDTVQKHALSSTSRLIIPAHVSLQSLGEDEGGVVLRLDTGELYTVNDTTMAFLQEIDGERTVADIATRLIEVFDTEEQTLLADLVDIANDLAGESLLTPAS